MFSLILSQSNLHFSRGKSPFFTAQGLVAPLLDGAQARPESRAASRHPKWERYDFLQRICRRIMSREMYIYMYIHYILIYILEYV